MTATVAGIHLGIDTHGNRPAGNAVPDGSLYSCSTHGLIYKSNLAGNSWATWGTFGSGMADPMTTRGDSIFRNASNVTDRLPIPAAGQVIGRVGSDLGSLYPPGYEYTYNEITSTSTPSATTEGTANTVVTASAVVFDGSTIAMIEFFASDARPDAGAINRQLVFVLYDDTGGGAASVGQIGFARTQAAQNSNYPVYLRRRLTPSNATHTYSIRAFVSAGTGSITAGAGGSSGTAAPAFIRITKV